MNLLEQSIYDIAGRLVLLAPAHDSLPLPAQARFGESRKYYHYLYGAQRLRGEIYLADNAIKESQLTADGRHCQPADALSWHLLAVDHNDSVCGCLRYHDHGPRATFGQLGVRHSALASSDVWGTKLARAVETEMALARCRRVSFAEVGGWAIAADRRCTVEALRMALSAFSLAQHLGGSLGITTATVRHHSSSILRRLGGHSLEADGVELPSYYDPRYRCEMEVLRFDSELPSPQYAACVGQLRRQLATVPVYSPWPRRIVYPVSEPRIAPMPQPAAGSMALVLAESATALAGPALARV